MRGSQRRRCSSVPWVSSVGPTRLMPTRFTGCGAPARAYSRLNSATCTGEAPRPPYSAGQAIPTQRDAASRACQVRPHATSSSIEANTGGISTLADSHARASAAKASSSVRRDRSTAAGLEIPEAPAAGGGELVLQRSLLLGREGPEGFVAAATHVEVVAAGPVEAELLVHQHPLQHLVGGGGGHGRRETQVARAPFGAQVAQAVD